MDTVKISIREASDEQLREFANNTLGLNLPGNTLRKTLLSKIDQAGVTGEIAVNMKAAAEPKQPAVNRSLPDAPSGKVKIIISRTEEPGGDRPVQIGVNGKVMLVPRGEEVEIPIAYFEVLENAVKHVYGTDREGNMEPVPRKVAMYPYQVISRPQQQAA